MTEYFGYFCALLIGLILGISGAGGSILTVPVLVYIMGITPVTATAYSLFIVGTTSAFGSIQNLINKLTDFKTALIYAFPSLIGVYISRRFLVPALPDTIFETESLVLTKGMALMLMFGIIIFFAGIAMLQHNQEEDSKSNAEESNPILLAIKLFLSGIVVGLVGAGGGFLFIPILIFTAKLPMKRAVATSLLIIAINSLAGFAGDLQNIDIDWTFLVLFTVISIGGIFIGIFLNRYINEKLLKIAFGWFVIMMSLFIFIRELFFTADPQ